MDNKTYLDQLDRIKKSIWLLDLKIERKEQALQPGPTPTDDTTRADELEKLKSSRAIIMQLYESFLLEVENLLDQQNSEISEILADRFLKSMTLREIAYHLGYGKTTISRRLDQGVDNLVLPNTPFNAESAFKASGVHEYLVC